MEEKLQTLVAQGVLTKEQVEKVIEVLKQPEEIRDSIVESLGECV